MNPETPKNENDNKVGLLPFAAIIICIYIFYKSVVLSINRSKLYLLLLILIPLILIAARNIYEHFNKMKIFAVLKSQWGLRENKTRNFDNISSLYKLYFENNHTNNQFCLDDQTWSDLNMDEIYSLIDSCKSTPGEHILYKLLRTTELTPDKLDKRNAIITFFENDPDAAIAIQYYLKNTGFQKSNSIVKFLWDDINISTAIKPFLDLMAILALGSIVSIFFINFKISILMMLIVLIVNTIIHIFIKTQIRNEISSITYLSKIINSSKNIVKIMGSNNCPEINEYCKELNELTDASLSIKRKLPDLSGSEAFDMSFDLVNIIFLIEERSFYSVIKNVKKLKPKLQQLYLSIGELDALICAASFRSGLKTYSVPEFSIPEVSNKHRELKLSDAVHPLVENAVPNSITVNGGGIIITGSNMSGKSTFLKTLGVNSVLAQTISTALCSEYQASFFKIITSISPSDNIIKGKSYYFGEAEAILRIIKEADSKVPVFCIIDEIFRGTNPIERISSAIEILNHLSSENVLTVVATHDIEITEYVSSDYKCYHFEEDANSNGLIFDYKIKNGVSTSTNAIKVLKILGYPENIIEGAMKRINIQKLHDTH